MNMNIASRMRPPMPAATTGGGCSECSNCNHDNLTDDNKNVKASKFTFMNLIVNKVIPIAVMTFLIIFSIDRLTMDKVYIINTTPSSSNVYVRTNKKFAEMGKVVYGSKGKNENTASLVREAIDAGFHHIATGAFHKEYDEAGVGEGWTTSGKDRRDVFLQTLFLNPRNKDYDTTKEESSSSAADGGIIDIKQHVHDSIASSLKNLQTDYLDAVLYHNFRATADKYEDMFEAWKVLEEYVTKGVIRYLGITSVHDEEYLGRLYDESKVKPSIIKNRFHANRGFDVSLYPLFKKMNVSNQTFWTLTGNWSTIRQDYTKQVANKKGITPEMYHYAFVMSLNLSPLIGTTSKQHMEEDLSLFNENKVEWDEGERETYAQKLGMDVNLLRQYNML